MATTRKRSSEQASPSAKKAKAESNRSNAIAIGDQIPDVTIPDQDGKEVALRDIKGVLVLFSYPKASTPGCTRQTRGFGEHYAEFAKLNATVYGLSADSEKAQTTFKTKLGLPFGLLSDTKYELLGPLGGKKSPKGVIRSHWVFVDGKLVFAEHGVKPDASPVDTLEAVKSRTESEAESESKPVSESESKPGSESMPESDVEPKPESDAEPKPESNGEPKPESNAEPDAEPESEAKPEAKPDSVSDSGSTTEAEAESTGSEPAAI
ncbi:Peroxiredoxin DOT5 [Wickerhamiella sorbophila]|uniref:thioredoxin-dependent peroxiredoxin n=1 Tax=Wickerhamiella sorbophila TaxID=45607 RepID=A0A2T0FHN1_9ASCO|nr:Peroxiredoxin DOT5 [Wickerhamiella sorbophila]PRT54508.1 Peroxiredoxin DOT5 [Wickerhamiella sorbophila]